MEIIKKLERLHEHVMKHPKDYQAVIAEIKAHSDYIEHRGWLKMIEREKRIVEIRKRREEYAKQHE